MSLSPPDRRPPSPVQGPHSELTASLAKREAYRERYWKESDPIIADRLLWRAQSIRHTVHLLPEQTILDLGCGSLMFTKILQQVSRNENFITAVTFLSAPELPRAGVSNGLEVLRVTDLPGPLAGRQFDCIVMMDLLDRVNSADVLSIIFDLLKPGGEIVTYESNPWNPIHKFRWSVSRLTGRHDFRYLINQRGLYEQLSEIGFVRNYTVFNDFVFAPLSFRMIWMLRNVSILLENTPLVRLMAGSILLHAQKPPREKPEPRVSLFRHESLRNAISVVVPCRNEEMNVAPLVIRLLALYGEYIFEIVTVDDGSTDGTRAVMEKLAAADPRVRPLIRKPPHGVGHAIKEGLHAARGPYVLTMDCDFQHLLPEFRDLFEQAAAGWDVVVGSRFSRHSVLLNYPFLKIVANRTFLSLARILLDVQFRDLTNNLKLMRREVVADLQLKQPGFAVNAETGLQPPLMGYRVKEVPISWINRTPGMGTSSFRLVKVGGGYWTVLRDLLRRRLWGTGPYRGLRRGSPPPKPTGGNAVKKSSAPAWMLAGIIALSAILQGWLAQRQPLWADEIFSVAVATGHSLEHPAAAARPELGDFVEDEVPRDRAEVGRYLQPEPGPPAISRVVRAAFLSDTSPPLYYVSLAGWIWLFNASDISVRAFSILLCLLCIPLIASIARRLGGRESVLPASLLFAVSPFTLFYGTEARMYSLLWLSVCATAWAALAARTARKPVVAGLIFIGVSAAGFLTHYFFLFPWAAIAGFLFLQPGRRRRWEPVLWAGVIAVLLLPWYSRLGASLGNWRITQDWLNWTPWNFSRPRAAWDLFTQFFTGSAPDLWAIRRRAVSVALVVSAVVILCATLRFRTRWLTHRRLMVVAWFVAASSAPLVFDLARGTYTAAVPRYAAGALPAAMLLIAVSLTVCHRWLRIGLIALLLLAWAANVRSLFQLRDRSGFRVREIVENIGDNHRSDDLVLVHSIPSGFLAVARYYQGSAALASWIGQLGGRTVPGSIQPLTAGRERIYFVRIHDLGAPSPEETWLRENRVLERERKWGPSQVSVFGRPLDQGK